MTNLILQHEDYGTEYFSDNSNNSGDMQLIDEENWAPSYRIESQTKEVPFTGGDTMKDNLLSFSEIKKINRQISSRIPPEETEKLQKEYSNLVDKKFNKGLSSKEEKKLKMIQWKLDRIYDAEMGEHMESLERLSFHYSDFASRLDSFVKQLKKDQIIKDD